MAEYKPEPGSHRHKTVTSIVRIDPDLGVVFERPVPGSGGEEWEVRESIPVPRVVEERL